MGGLKRGIDSKGRRYATLNGKRVQVGDSKERRRARPVRSDYLRDPIRKLMDRYRREGGDAKAAVSRMIQQHFNTLFSIAAKTSVGKFGKAYAAREILSMMRGGLPDKEPDEKDKKFLESITQNGDLDGRKFLAHLKDQGVNISLPEPTKAQDATPTGMNEDQKILEIVHRYSLSASQLERVLSKTLHKDSKNPSDST